jgi:AAA family ATP:ADP antiporter
MRTDRRELIAAACISVAAGFVLAGYSAIRNASSTLFKEAYGAGKLPLLMAVMPIGVLLVLVAYARVLSWLGPRRTLMATTLGCGAVIAGFYGVIRTEGVWPGARLARAGVRIFSDAYIALLIEQYWSFLTSTLDTRAAKRLNGPIMGVASLGAVAGAWLVGGIVERFGTVNMLLVAAASLLPAAIISDCAYRAAGEPKRERTAGVAATRASDEGGHRGGGLGLPLFRREPLLVAILVMVVATQVLAAVVDLNYQTVLQDVIPARDAQTKWAVRFEAVMNLLAAFMQFVAAPLLLRFVPVGVILVAMPVIQAVVTAVSFAHPTLGFAAGAYVVFKMFDYSLFKAAKETLYIPLSYDARYRAKEVVDVLAYRSAKGATSAVIAVFERAVGTAVARAYGPVALAATVLWAGAAFMAGRLGARATAAAENSSGTPSDSAEVAR